MIIDSDELGITVVLRLQETGWSSRQTANLMGLTDTSSPKRWLNGDGAPNGELQIRLWHIMHELGVESPEMGELENASAFGYYLGRLFALRVITLGEAKTICGLKKPQNVYRILRGQPSLNTKESMESLREKYDATLETAVKALHEVLASPDQQLLPTNVAASVEPKAEPAEEEGEVLTETLTHSVQSDELGAKALVLPSTSDRELSLANMAFQLGALLPVARFLVSDKCTPEERALVRSLLGEEGIFELSRLISRLCGERANTTLGKGN